MSDIQLVTFDLDNTLWDVMKTIVRAEKMLRAWMSENTPRALDIYLSDAASRIREEVVAQYPEQRFDLSFLRTQVLFHCMRESGLSDARAEAAAQQAFEVFFVGRNDVALFDNARSVLAELSASYTLFALTNGNANIDRAGIGEFFSGAVSSADVGASKPDLLMFTTVLERAGVGADRAVHIGDHLSDDILGANQAGMRSIWFNHRGEFSNDGESQPTAEVHELDQLPNAIAAL